MAMHPTHYHVGIVVTDIGAARTRLSTLLGVSWGPLLRLDATDYRDGAGNDLTLPTTMCYSVGDPCLELIEEVPGSVWVRNEHSNLHHIGFWSEGLAEDSTGLAGGGCPMQLCGRGRSGRSGVVRLSPRQRRWACGSSSWTRRCARPWRSSSNRMTRVARPVLE